MLKKTLMASAIAAASLASINAQAQSQQTTPVRDNGFSYTYGQFGYDNWDYDNGPDVDVLTGEGSFALDEHLFLRGGASFYDGDYDSPGNDDVDGNRLYVGAGFHTPLQRGLDLVGTADVIRDDNDFNDEEWGYAVSGGLRHQTTEVLERGHRNSKFWQALLLRALAHSRSIEGNKQEQTLWSRIIS